jgi:hypothetical protein
MRMRLAAIVCTQALAAFLTRHTVDLLSQRKTTSTKKKACVLSSLHRIVGKV